MIKGTYDLLSGNPLTYVTTVPNLILYRYYGSGNITVSSCHMTLRDNMDQMDKRLGKWEPLSNIVGTLIFVDLIEVKI